MNMNLEKYGKVEQFEQIGDEYHIKITDGFDRNAMNTFACMKEICEAIPDFPIVKSIKTDTNILHLILKPLQP